MSKKTDAEKTEAIEKLRGWIKPGDTVYTVLDHVSRSGMSRHIRVMLLSPATPEDLARGRNAVIDLHPNWAVGRALGLRHARRNGRELDALIVGGCGMDMGFHLVYSLGATIYRGGFGCIGKGCPSNDHSNGDRDYTPHDDGTPRPQGCTCSQIPGQADVCPVCKEAGYYSVPRPGGEPFRHYHQDGGYALRHRWL